MDTARALPQAAPSPAARRAGETHETDFVIETRELSKVFTGRRRLRGGREPATLAVDRVTLRLAAGEIVGLVGPNGAGKTTLIRMLSTMVLPTSGSAWVGGHDVTCKERAVRRLVGLVSSNERSFYWRLTGRENLRFFSNLYRIHGDDADTWRDELIDLLGLTKIADRRFDHYSTGEKQRLAIARGMLTRPRILLMDEPTKGVDPIGAAEIIQLVRDRVLALWHPTILITSHNLWEIERLCGRVALMDQGRIIALGPISELRERVQKADKYRMTVSGVSADRLRTMAADAGALPSVEVSTQDNVVVLEIEFSPGSDGFSRIVRAVVESGGELIACSSTLTSFDEVFYTLVGEAVQQRREQI